MDRRVRPNTHWSWTGAGTYELFPGASESTLNIACYLLSATNSLYQQLASLGVAAPVKLQLVCMVDEKEVIKP